MDGIPVGVTISDGSHSFTASRTRSKVDLGNWNRSNLSVTPPANSDQDFTLQVELVARERDNGAEAVVTKNVSVIVNAVADLPSLDAVVAITVDEDTSSQPFSLAAELTDTRWQRVVAGTADRYSGRRHDLRRFSQLHGRGG